MEDDLADLMQEIGYSSCARLINFFPIHYFCINVVKCLLCTVQFHLCFDSASLSFDILLAHF